MTSTCAVCGVIANLKCGGCKITFYCGKDHQKLHWKSEHKIQCKMCYKICTNDKFGRYVIAQRDIKKNEIILTELPLVAGPKITSEPICLGCYKRIKSPTTGDGDGYECTQCHWPLCSKKCETSKNHLYECNAISKANLPCPITSNQVASAYCVITPLRCLLMKSENPKSYEKLMSLEDHLAERINTSIYQVLKMNLVPYIRNVLGLKEYDEELILKIAAILDTNTFEIRSKLKGNTKIRAIYPEAAMFSHDCVPNTRHIFDDDVDETMKLTVLATVDIPKGSIITVTYTQPLKCTIDRRDHLKLSKCFDCCCERCADPTEFGTYCGSILCFQCKIGKMISTNPLDQMAKWKCEKCQHELLAKQIRLGNKSIQNEIDQLIGKRSPLAFEEFLIKYENTLHPLNTHVIQVKYALIQLYGNTTGFMLNELNAAALKRKIELCTELLEIADSFEPGASHFRGKILLDLQDAIAVDTKREFDAELITRQQTEEKLGESMNLLQEAIGILKLEPGMKNILENRIDKLVAEI